jgi:hypothetical protein
MYRNRIWTALPTPTPDPPTGDPDDGGDDDGDDSGGGKCIPADPVDPADLRRDMKAPTC